MKNVSVKMIIVLTVTSVVTAGILAGFFEIVSPMIEANRLEEEKRAIFAVLPEAKGYEIIEKEKPSEKDAGHDKEIIRIFKGLDDKGNVVGYAFLAEGPGFQGIIRMMVGINVDLKTLSGMKVTEQVETPGLGNKITDEKFEGQFKGVVIEPKIEYLKNKKPEKPNEIQAITGATISSRAVVNAINKKTAVVIAILKSIETDN